MAGCMGNYIALFVTVETHFVTGKSYEEDIEWTSEKQYFKIKAEHWF